MFADAEIWSQFGLAGLVIFALFSALVSIVLYTIKKLDKIDERNIKASLYLSKEHKEERDEWRNSNSKQADRFENAVNLLSISIKNSK